MDRVRSIALLGDIMTFTDSLDFLDSQYTFDIVFGDDPTMLTLTPRKKGQCTTENMDDFITKLNEFCNLCRLHIFCDSVQLKYVGTDVYNAQKYLRIFYLNFRNLKWFIPFAEEIFSLTPMICLVILLHFCLYFHQM